MNEFGGVITMSVLQNNDMMAQCTRKLIKISDEETEKRVKEIENCDHLFVKLRENKEFIDNPDATLLDCVNCGVTNKFFELESRMMRYRRSFEYYLFNIVHKLDIDYNDTTIESTMMIKLRQKTHEFNLMSDEILRTFHPGLLYQIAKVINPSGTNEELFHIMKELNELETTKERNKLSQIDDANELIERYYENKGKVLKK